MIPLETDAVSVLFSEPKIPQFAGHRRQMLAVREFQCSSASRKFLNSTLDLDDVRCHKRFQCSSASRKFLNSTLRCDSARNRRRFSALQRAENSSIVRDGERDGELLMVSVLFSEPKIPQLRHEGGWCVEVAYVSVLFSEPKIPQL